MFSGFFFVPKVLPSFPGSGDTVKFFLYMPVISVKSFLEVEEGVPFNDWSFQLHAELECYKVSCKRKVIFLKKNHH